jgi:hypothetical protein
MSVSIAISKRRTPKARHKLQIESKVLQHFGLFPEQGLAAATSLLVSLEREREREKQQQQQIARYEIVSR